MPKQEHTFKRFGASEDGSHWDLTDVVDEHSDHIEKLELALEGALHTIGRLVETTRRLLAWQRDVVAGVRSLADEAGATTEPEDH